MKAEERMLQSQRRLAASNCLTESCIKSAARILESVDREVDPCEDFYQFACGGWISQHPVPESQSSWDQFRALREQLLIQLRALLEEEGSEEDVKPVQQARTLYRACLDTDKLEALGLEPMLTVLQKLGLSSTNVPPSNQPFDWLETIGQSQRMLGLNVLVGFWVSQDVRNTSRNLMVVDQISPGISERYLLDPARFQTELTEYHRYIRDMVLVFQRHLYNSSIQNATMPLSEEAAAAFADDVLHFSTQLAAIMTPAEARRDTKNLFHEMTVYALQNLTDLNEDYNTLNTKLNWTRYLEFILDNTNVTLDFDSDLVVVMDVNYLQKLAALVSVTKQETLERFVWWTVFSTLAPLTLQEFRDLAFRFSQKVFGLQQKTARWKGCTGNVNSNFGMAVSYLYVQKHFNNESREKALEMVNDIREAFTEIVMELDWMDSETKQRTLEKAHAMRPFIGFPGWLLTPGELEKYYEGAEVVDGLLFETYLRLSEESVKTALEDLRKPPDYNRWVTPATTVNAFYSPILNSVTFPAGILQPPFYGLGLESLNYGAIGAIMGHELTHGFDDQGRRYDKDGNLKQWWTEETLKEYENRVQCIVDQYNQYNVSQLGDNFTVNGINTQGENIADNGGLREAMRAYQKFQNRLSAEQLLPGLSQYSPEQLFFLGFAHMWCGNSTRGALKSRVVDGVHSPNRFRVIGTLSNSKEFSKAWGCPAGSPMNPDKKCVLW
ncbi:neprilysin-11-like isoform X2 [Periplaneta americana]